MHTLHTPEQAAQWLRQRVHTALRADSRRVQAGDGFVAWPGAAVDGRQFVRAALAQGAAACLVEAQDAQAWDWQGLPADALACYPGLKAATGPIAAAFYEYPAQSLAVLAVTGTNGKTSSAWWLAQALAALPAPWTRPCALVGTLGIGLPPRAAAQAGTDAYVDADADGDAASSLASSSLVSTGLTTPDPVLLQHSLRQFVTQGLRACAMEASSIGLEEHRLDGTRVRVALFTNFTQDHLDYHGSMAAYWSAKARLFAWEGLQAAVINVDDAQGARLADSLRGSALDVWTVACRSDSATSGARLQPRLQARALGYNAAGLHFEVVEGAQVEALSTHLIGDYNAANLLGVIAALRSVGVPLAAAVQACRGLQPVPGRMECVTQAGQPLVAVDYAHTPDALQHALAALRPLAQARGGQLWCVFGCGGDRDASKRPLMGGIAAQWADRVVITSDNPRSEAPQAIVAQILQGAALQAAGAAPQAQVQVEINRAAAIAQAIARAAPQDVVLLAGKGHESTQEVAGEKTPFSDRSHALQALALRTPLAAGARA